MDSQRADAAVSGPHTLEIGALEPDVLEPDMARVLILGGTTEARLLAERLATRGALDVTVSLAGRTSVPVAHAVPVRVGGFGGASGLADHLKAEHIDALIDATHPYANVMSENAAAAARQTGVQFMTLRRPPWRTGDGDRWTVVDDTTAAVRALGDRPRRVFIALGRNDLAPFVTAPHHFYLIRSVDPVDPPLPLPDVIYVVARGPFGEAEDRALMHEHRIGVVIAKNSGGRAAYGKIAAARTLGIDVVMLRRPQPPAGPAVESVDDAIAWLDHALTFVATRGV